MVNIILCDDEVESLQRTQDEIERIKTRLPLMYLRQQIRSSQFQNVLTIVYPKKQEKSTTLKQFL